jgi:putative component of membrane protein insertase Oxa1/YidC/SpoIIIJ protein YidD
MAGSVRASQTKDWTVLVYMEGRDRLAKSTEQAINKLEKVGSNDHVDIVVQSTLVPTEQEERCFGLTSRTTLRQKIVKDDQPDQVTSPVIEDLGKTVPLDQNSLADFVKWGMKEYPARHTMLVIKKHGLGFAQAGENAPLSARELGQALQEVKQSTGRAIDLLSWDACSMQQMEVAQEVVGAVKVMTGSQEDVYAHVFPYTEVVHTLQLHPDLHTGASMGRVVVDGHRKFAPGGIHSALDLEQARVASGHIKSMVGRLLQAGVPRDTLYTHLMAAPSMEPTSLDSLNLDFRDLPSFLERIARDESLPVEARKSAMAAQKNLGEAFIDQYHHEVKQILKPAQGVSAYMPWKPVDPQLKEGYEQLAWSKETNWGDLLDYVFEGPVLPEAAPGKNSADKNQEGSLGQRLSRRALGAYKKYMSAPYHGRVCSYTDVSCSQYAKEAIAEHGLVEGSKMGVMRLLGCSAGERVADPVPRAEQSHQHSHSHQNVGHQHQELPEVRLSPPARVEETPRRKAAERLAAELSGKLGKAVGSAVGAAVGAPLGAALGGVFGWDAGRDRLDMRNQRLERKYGASKTNQLKKLETLTGGAAVKTRERVTQLTGSGWLGRGVGALIGGLTGAALGALGGGLKGMQEGGFFISLLSENLVRDRLGNLPPVYETERLLAADRMAG